jgi:hypothetical protein
MLCLCPECGRAVKTHEGKRYLPGKWTEKRNIVHSELYKVFCRSRRGCKWTFIFQLDFPLDAQLAPAATSHQNWALFANALRSKPGIPVGGTTYSEYTQRISRGVITGHYLELVS